MALVIKSPAFTPNGSMPIKFTCEDDDVSPALEWSGVPERAKSLALIVDDPDAPDPKAPKMVYVHWVLYDIPPSSAGLPEGVTSTRLPTGTCEGKNDFGKLGYGGPCPPIGRHLPRLPAGRHRALRERCRSDRSRGQQWRVCRVHQSR